MRPAFLLILIGFSFFLGAQNYVQGKITDSTKAPVPYVAIALLNAKDSSVYRGINTDDNGGYVFKDIKKGKYLIKIAAVGFKENLSNTFVIDSASQVQLPDIVLAAEGINLTEVSVSTQKRTFEFKGGNITVNVDGSPLAVGNSAYDLLSRLPGVTVDDANISINGQSGVRILIDDRMQQVSGVQLVTLLKSLPASFIDKIEVLKVPPVKYDAGGGAGLINIRTKKIKITGFSGSTYANVSQGFYTHYGSGISLNFKGKKLSFFSGLNLSQNPTRYDFEMKRTIQKDTFTTRLHQLNINKTVDRPTSYYFGTDWFINKKNILGFKFESAPGYSDADRRGQVTLQNNDLGYDLLPYHSFTRTEWKEYNANINYEHLLDTMGSKIKFVSDYNSHYLSIDGKNDNRFRDINGNDALPPMIYTSYNKSGIIVLASKFDLEKKFSKTFSIDAGVKYSYQDMYSNFELKRQNNSTGIFETDTTFTNEFIYNEQIQAAYVNFQKEIKKFNLTAGLRAENTIVNSRSITKGTKYNREYLGFFPVISLDYNQSNENNFSISYNRRLERPNYSQFNPYRAFYSNILISGQGNPYLRPQYNNAFTLSHTYKGRITNSFSYSLIEDWMLGYSTQNDSTKQIIWQQGNLKYTNNYAYNLYTNNEITKWWNLTFNAGFYIFSYNGNLNGQDYKASGFSYGLWAHNQFVLPGEFKLEVSSFCIGPWLSGVYHTHMRGALHMAIRRSFFNKKLDVSFACEDILYTLSVYNYVKYQNLDFYTRDKFDSRRFNFGLTYNFGKLKVQQRKNVSSEDEKRRMGGR